MVGNEMVCILDADITECITIYFDRLCHFAKAASIREVMESKKHIPDQMICPGVDIVTETNINRVCPLCKIMLGITENDND